MDRARKRGLEWVMHGTRFTITRSFADLLESGMDPNRFDTLTRTLSTGSTRRKALTTALGSALSFLGTRQGEARRKASRGRQQERRREASAEGPCGDGSGKDNACTRHRQCCTGICHKKKNDDQGRCRCRKLGQSCVGTRNCCADFGQPMTCQNGTCQTVPNNPPPTQPAQSCAETCPGCCDESGQCQAGTTATACGRGGTSCIRCTAPETCGGGAPGTSGVCGCTPPITCEPQPQGTRCGVIPNGCGDDTTDCGACTGTDLCGGGGFCTSSRQGICSAGPPVCPVGAPTGTTACNNRAGCVCAKSTEGNIVCTQLATLTPPCTTSVDCPPLWFCLDNGSTCAKYCQPWCGSPVP
jgi:hypothetical protein